ncbi:MAG: ParB/RepB/Spo0J family partition protein [Chloroflexi bacterium]|nr:ParB/RepB/Spo0J family partition protein [Chloroflexota bacterium]
MPRPKGGLGRGLGALIPLSAPSVVEVGLDSIVANPRQPRQALNAVKLQELAASLREHGVIQPLVVTELEPVEDREPDAPRYQLIAGERRWQAARIAGLSTVPVIIKEAPPEETLELALVENLQRADLNPLEEANAYRQLMEEFGLTQEIVAARVGRSRVAVANSLRLLSLPEEVKESLAGELISEGHARALLGLPAKESQVEAMKALIAKGLSVRQAEELVRRWGRRSPGAQGKEKTLDGETRSLEDDFRRALGTKVSLFRRKKGGKLVVYFYSEEELQGIYQVIVRR